MATFGELLRQHRLARGIELSQIADETRIMQRYLVALETGDHKQIPGAVFARSFARQYAQMVGLEYSQIQAEVAAAFPIEEQLPPAESRPAAQGIEIKPLTDWLHINSSFWRQLPRPMFSLLGVLLACSAVYMGWQRVVLGTGQNAAMEAAQSVPPTKLPAATSETLPTAPITPPTISSEQQATLTNTSAGTPAAVTGQNTTLELQAGTSGVSVRVVASQETWVSITANGKRLYRGVLQPNEARVLTGVENATMVIGNAGGVDVQKDGRSIGPIGPPGQVRVVQLSPDGMQIKRQADPATTSTT
ncbi:MAG: DUF4115 domain-containing protein [Bryobacterales bacterium]|nr:DUF4115 domain-containing protein [Bryobacterales bacterium]